MASSSSKAVARKTSPAPRRRTPPVARPAVEPAVDMAVDAAVEEVIEQMVETLAQSTVDGDASALGDPTKQKLVRDSFTMPKNEYQAIDALKKRLLLLSLAAKKGELLRAGIAALVRMTDDELLAAVGRIPSLKTGRPKSAK